ncbi:MAG: Gfo/Idh/MocA family protein [Janthinobacterium lividum]
MTQSTPPREGLGVAVVGAGMAGRSHANGYRQAPTVFGPDLPPLRLAAIADANLPLAQDTARRYGFERAVGSWQEIAADPSIDVVSVVVGNALHREVVQELLAAGKHVLCEKPLAGSLEDAEAMVHAAEKAVGQVAALGYSYRRTPAFAALAARVVDGGLGTITNFTGHYWCDYSCNPSAPWTWRYAGGPGSGAVSDLGSHTLDLAELLCGRVELVSGAQFSTVVTERPLPLGHTVGHQVGAVSQETRAVDNEDTAVFTVRFAGGATGSFSISRVAFGYANGQGLEVSGTSGRASLDLQRPAEYVLDDDQPAVGSRGPRVVTAGPGFPYYAGGLPTDAPGLSYGYSDMFVWQTRAFLDQVSGVQTALPACASFADGLHTLRVIDAIAASARGGGVPVAVEG